MKSATNHRVSVLPHTALLRVCIYVAMLRAHKIIVPNTAYRHAHKHDHHTAATAAAARLLVVVIIGYIIIHMYTFCALLASPTTTTTTTPTTAATVPVRSKPVSTDPKLNRRVPFTIHAASDSATFYIARCVLPCICVFSQFVCVCWTLRFENCVFSSEFHLLYIV